jgi:hypothetical protein
MAAKAQAGFTFYAADGSVILAIRKFRRGHFTPEELVWARRSESDPFAARKVIHLGA